MIFVKSFKGYEDKTRELDEKVNEWILQHQIEILDLRCCLGHEPGGRAGSGDIIYTVTYRADEPVRD